MRTAAERCPYRRQLVAWSQKWYDSNLMKLRALFITTAISAVISFVPVALGQQAVPADDRQLWQELGGATFENWKGLTPGNDGAAELKLPGEATWRHSDGPRGVYNHGFRRMND